MFFCSHSADRMSPNRHDHFSTRDSDQKPAEFLRKVSRQRPAICLLSRQKWRVSAIHCLKLSYCFSKEMCVEARAGIEPACKDLQSSASPLRHRASRCDRKASHVVQERVPSRWFCALQSDSRPFGNRKETKRSCLHGKFVRLSESGLDFVLVLTRRESKHCVASAIQLCQ